MTLSPTGQAQPIPHYRIRREILEHMDPMRRMVAKSLIVRGEWILVE